MLFVLAAGEADGRWPPHGLKPLIWSNPQESLGSSNRILGGGIGFAVWTQRSREALTGRRRAGTGVAGEGPQVHPTHLLSLREVTQDAVHAAYVEAEPGMGVLHC